MSVEQNKTIVRRFSDAINQQGTDLFFQVIDENVADTYVLHDPSFAGFGRGPEGYKKWVLHISSTTKNTDHSFTIEDMFGEGDKVVTRYTFRYTDADGKRRARHNINIMHFANGKITDEWDVSEPLPEGTPA